MKRLPLTSFVFALSLLTISSEALSEEPAPAQAAAPLPNIRIELQVVAVPEQIGLPLAAEMKSKDQIEAANTRIQQMLAKGTAKLIGWPIVTTHSGIRAVVEDIQELRYATEYVPPTVSVSPNMPTDSTIKVVPSVDVTTFEGVPSAFETRNTGVTLEVEPVLKEDGKTIELNIVPQHVRLKEFRKIIVEGAARKGKVVVEQPVFDTRKVTTSMAMQSGQRMLMGVYPTDAPPKHLEFFILKVEVIPIE
jgi:Flp pilus assembly secretin CpaC